MFFRTLALAFTLTVLPLAAASHAGTPESDKARAEIKAALGFVPAFLDGLPDLALPGVWHEMAGLQLNPSTRLSGKTKELIGLAVAAQIPCRYCIYAHTAFAKLDGASKAELGEAVAMAASTRHWSTFLNGIMTDEAAFRAEIDRTVAFMKNPGKTAAPAPADPALAQAQAAFGSVPEFLARFPASGRAGAWEQMRDVELAAGTALDAKTKSLVGIAVAAQIPCRFCLIADTTFAKLGGATQDEIDEAIAMASLVRSLSTFLNGLQADDKAFMRDVDRLVKNASKQAQSR